MTLIFCKVEEKRVFLQVCRSWRKLAEDEIFWLLRSRGSKSIVLMQPTIFVEHNVCKSKVDIPNFGDYIFSDEDDPIIIEEKKRDFLWASSPI